MRLALGYVKRYLGLCSAGPINDVGLLVDKFELAGPEPEGRFQLPCAKKRLHFGAGGFNRRMVGFHRHDRAAGFDPNEKAGCVMAKRRRAFVIHTLNMPNFVMQRLNMRIIHRGNWLARVESLESETPMAWARSPGDFRSSKTPAGSFISMIPASATETPPRDIRQPRPHMGARHLDLLEEETTALMRSLPTSLGMIASGSHPASGRGIFARV